jgi:flagellar motility protein MotE (MotC chaperone)
MIKSNRAKTETSEQELPSVSDIEDPVTLKEESEAEEDAQDIDGILNSLKTLLSTVEKLQKVRQEVGDIKPLIGRMLDGELVAGEELEQLKTGVNGLTRLVKVYSDHQAALAKAQPARNLLDQLLKEGKNPHPQGDEDFVSGQ